MGEGSKFKLNKKLLLLHKVYDELKNIEKWKKAF